MVRKHLFRREGLLRVLLATAFPFGLLGGGGLIEGAARPEPVNVPIANATQDPDFSRLPEFYSSNAEYDAFVNDYFMRHLSVDERGIYLGGGPILFSTDHMWVIEWDQYLFPWIDRGAMGLKRQGGDTRDIILSTLRNVTMGKTGHVWGGALRTEAKNAVLSWIPLFGWPWPKFDRNYTTDKPTGWDFNNLADGAREAWTATDIDLEPGYSDYSLVGTITGSTPSFLSPEFDTDAFQAPIIELDIQYASPSGKGADKMVEGLRILWTTDADPDFADERSVGIDFSDVPPSQFPADYAYLAFPQQARYPLYFAMCEHLEWGRGGKRIRRLKIVPTGAGAEGTTVSLNYVRASYDTRYATNNAILINATWRAFAWSGDEEFLTGQMPRLRRAMLFLNEHLRGKEEGLLDHDWFVGHEGAEGLTTGRSIPCGYWDLMPAGRYDLDACIYYYQALRAMAQLERATKARGIAVPDVTVLGPDHSSRLSFRETPESLDALAAKVKARIEEVFWVPETQRFARCIDAKGEKKDYGFLHMNLMALHHGIGTEAQRDAILSWLDGRVIAGDTSTGTDIYRWRFAPRMTTKRNEEFYYWAWVWERNRDPDNPQFVWGNQMQDGGGVPFTSFFELAARTSTGRQNQIDRAFGRTLEIGDWFRDVKAAGGEGRDFYRTYYTDPERGMLQGGGPAGGLGMDREFLSDAALGTVFVPEAFLRVEAPEDGVLALSPTLPSGLDKIGMRNLFYRGNHLAVEAGRGYVSLEGSRIPSPSGLRLRVTLRNVPERFVCLVDGKPVEGAKRNARGEVRVETDLAPVRIEVRAQP